MAIYLKWHMCPCHEPLVALIPICSHTFDRGEYAHNLRDPEYVHLISVTINDCMPYNIPVCRANRMMLSQTLPLGKIRWHQKCIYIDCCIARLVGNIGN